MANRSCFVTMLKQDTVQLPNLIKNIEWVFPAFQPAIKSGCQKIWKKTQRALLISGIPRYRLLPKAIAAVGGGPPPLGCKGNLFKFNELVVFHQPIWKIGSSNWLVKNKKCFLNHHRRSTFGSAKICVIQNLQNLLKISLWYFLCHLATTCSCTTNIRVFECLSFRSAQVLYCFGRFPFTKAPFRVEVGGFSFFRCTSTTSNNYNLWYADNPYTICK